jgi:hypothetical protein
MGRKMPRKIEPERADTGPTLQIAAGALAHLRAVEPEIG